MRYLTILFAVCLAFGCASTYEQQDVAAPAAKLESGKSILIATPANGMFETIVYEQSGQMTAAAVETAFAKHTEETAVAPDCRDVECLQTQPDAADYLVVPEILHWEDRNTEWSGKKDQLEVKLTVYSSTDLTILTATVVSGKSKWMTFGGDHPQDLLPEPIGQFVDSLF